MEKKPRNKAVKPPTKVSIVRPEATVSIEINGIPHKLTEAEAKELHTKLTSVLNIQPPENLREIYRRISENHKWNDQAIPAPPPIRPLYIQPSHPQFRPGEVICQVGGSIGFD
jgi:hypothetical protein